MSGPPDQDQDCTLSCVRVVHFAGLWDVEQRARYKHWRAKSKFYCAGRCITGGEVTIVAVGGGDM